MNNDQTIEELLHEALRPVRKEITGRAVDPFHPTWNPEAHIELTITIAEARSILNAFRIAEGKKPRNTK